jgi:hypothetical protein
MTQLSSRMVFALVLIGALAAGLSVGLIGSNDGSNGRQDVSGSDGRKAAAVGTALPRANWAKMTSEKSESAKSEQVEPQKQVEPQERASRAAPPVAWNDRSEELINGYTPQEQRAFKESYSCDLASVAREACESVKGGDEEYEQCLSLRQYYTYSRHCGYEP